MARKRKYNQISKKQSLSSSSEKLSEKEEIKHQNKRMKLDNTPDDKKVVFESRRKGKYHNLNSIKNLVMLLFFVKDQALQINLLRIQLLITQSSLWGINQMRRFLNLLK